MSKPCAAACRTGADINIYYGGISFPFLFFFRRGGEEKERIGGGEAEEAEQEGEGRLVGECGHFFRADFFFFFFSEVQDEGCER